MWQDKIPDTEVLKKAKMQSVTTCTPCYKNGMTTKYFAYGELQEGKRSHGGQTERYIDTIKPRGRISHYANVSLLIKFSQKIVFLPLKLIIISSP